MEEQVDQEVFISSENLKRKSKSPSVFREPEPKRPKQEYEDDKVDDIAKQYKKFQASPKYNLNSEELFCICRKPDHGGELMISCDGCDEWFHARCMKIEPDVTSLIDKFYCKFCHWKDIGTTKWSRKCRLKECNNAIRKAEKSKYCSDECGEKFLRKELSLFEALSQSDLKFVVTYCANYADLKKMGLTFPELPEVVSMDLKKFPADVRDLLSLNSKEQRKIESEIEKNALRSKRLGQIKDLIKAINEKIQNDVNSTLDDSTVKKNKSKKSKSNRIDLCCFQSDLVKDFFRTSQNPDQILLSAKELFEDDINEAAQAYSGSPEHISQSICLQDRRKCFRHSAWLNLLTDRVWKCSMELQNVLEKLSQEKQNILREHSISVYDKET